MYLNGVYREVMRVLNGLIIFIPGQTYHAVSPAKVLTWTTAAAIYCRAYKQRLAFLAVNTLKFRQEKY